MNFSSDRRNNEASSTMIPQRRRNEEGRISIGPGQEAQTALDTLPPAAATQNLKGSATSLEGMKAGIESLQIGRSGGASSSATAPKKMCPPSSHKVQQHESDGQDADDGLNVTRQLIGKASTGSPQPGPDASNEDATYKEHSKGQVFQKLGAFVQEQKDDEQEAPRMTPPAEAEVSLTLNDMTSASEAVQAPVTDSNQLPRSLRQISFSRLDDVMASDDDDDDDDKSMTIDDLMEMSASDRASPPTSVRELIRSSAAETTATSATGADYDVSIEAPLKGEGKASRRSSAISFECHDSVLFDLLAQEISDDDDEIDPQRNPSFYNESIGSPNVLSRMDQSILAREVSNGRLARDGMHFSFSRGLNLDDQHDLRDG